MAEEDLYCEEVTCYDMPEEGSTYCLVHQPWEWNEQNTRRFLHLQEQFLERFGQATDAWCEATGEQEKGTFSEITLDFTPGWNSFDPTFHLERNYYDDRRREWHYYHIHVPLELIWRPELAQERRQQRLDQEAKERADQACKEREKADRLARERQEQRRKLFAELKAEFEATETGE